MIDVTADVKNALKARFRSLDAYFEFDGNEYHPLSFTIDHSIFSSSSDTYIGSFVGKSGMIKLQAADNVDLENKWIDLYEGILVNGTFQYSKIGVFLVYEKTESNEFSMADKRVLFNTQVLNIDLASIKYPISVYELAQWTCSKVGIELANSNFPNSTLQIKEQISFGTNPTYADIVTAIAQASCSFAVIDGEGKLFFKWFKTQDFTIETDNLLSSWPVSTEKFGPVNSLVLAREPLNDYVFIRDETSIEKNGLCEMRIVNNPILDIDRHLFKIEFFNRISGFEYMPTKAKTQGLFILEAGDVVSLQQKDGSYINMYIMNHTLKYSGSSSSELDSPALSKTQIDYQLGESVKEKLKRTEAIVDKQNQKIELVVETIDRTVEELDFTKIYKALSPPEEPFEGMLWLDVSDANNPILFTWVQISTDEEENPIFGWVQGNDHTEIQKLQKSYQELTSEEWVAQVGEQILNSEDGKELVKKEELSAQLKIVKDQINATLEEMSGYNLLLNSVGWNDTSFWELGNGGSVETISNNDVSDNSVSEHAFKIIGTNMSQNIKVTKGNSYTISCSYKKYLSTSSIKILQGSTETIVFETDHLYLDDEWHSAELTFEASCKEITVIINSSSNYLMVTDLIINDGPIKKQWTSHNDEIYTAGVCIDKTGIKIDQSDTDTSVQINSKEFAVLDKNSGDKILRINQDTTELTKLRCKETTEVGKLMIVPSGDKVFFVIMD